MKCSSCKVHGGQTVCEDGCVMRFMSVWVVWDGRCGRVCGMMKGPVYAGQLRSLNRVGFLASRWVDEMRDTEVDKGCTKAVRD